MIVILFVEKTEKYNRETKGTHYSIVKPHREYLIWLSIMILLINNISDILLRINAYMFITA